MNVSCYEKKKKKQQVFITIESSNEKKKKKRKERALLCSKQAHLQEKSQELSQHDWECNAQRRRANTTAVDTYTNADYHK